jgi:hypothetical protein
MPITQTSRTGQTYYLRTGPKRGGGAQYYFSTKSEGSLAEAVPEGFEIYESVQGQVYLCRKQPKLIHDEEKASIERLLNKLQPVKLYKIEARGKSITIFDGSSGVARLANLAPFHFPAKDPSAKRALQERFATYQPVMRFTLTGSKLRLFDPERFCFRGSVEDWISIGPPDPLEKLASKFLKHLGQDSFYDLY